MTSVIESICLWISREKALTEPTQIFLMNYCKQSVILVSKEKLIFFPYLVAHIIFEIKSVSFTYPPLVLVFPESIEIIHLKIKFSLERHHQGVWR